MSKGMSSEDFQDQAKYKSNFIKYKKDLDRKLNFEEMNSDELIEVASFLGMHYFTGTYMMSALLKLVVNTPFYLSNFAFMVGKSEKRF